MTNQQIYAIIGAAVITLVTQLLAGKMIKRLLLLPFEYLSSRTDNKIDDVLVDEAEKDLGIESRTLPPSQSNTSTIDTRK